MQSSVRVPHKPARNLTSANQSDHGPHLRQKSSRARPPIRYVLPVDSPISARVSDQPRTIRDPNPSRREAVGVGTVYRNEQAEALQPGSPFLLPDGSDSTRLA